MTLDEMFKQYIHNAVEEYLRTRNNTTGLSDYITESSLACYLSDNDYMTRDDVSDQINGATVYIEASLSA